LTIDDLSIYCDIEILEHWSVAGALDHLLESFEYGVGSVRVLADLRPAPTCVCQQL
jgi:hypothetical protein